jgi:hypothetical protein
MYCSQRIVVGLALATAMGLSGCPGSAHGPRTATEALTTMQHASARPDDVAASNGAESSDWSEGPAKTASNETVSALVESPVNDSESDERHQTPPRFEDELSRAVDNGELSEDDCVQISSLFRERTKGSIKIGRILSMRPGSIMVLIGDRRKFFEFEKRKYGWVYSGNGYLFACPRALSDDTASQTNGTD